ncbi:hypothetical protein [Miltoncostaea marina]|uniref:hypothetical protein n=1 Tax=Miltoncostaea marina TaxID=2843215 RepID=UPI001C3E8059|nr:hypothetical protein [Miltoncostaea marina]
MITTALDPLHELPIVCARRDWDLHVERAGAFARTGSGEGEPLWVATVGRRDFALEAQGPTPTEALARLYAEVARYCRLPAPARTAETAASRRRT